MVHLHRYRLVPAAIHFDPVTIGTVGDLGLTWKTTGRYLEGDALAARTLQVSGPAGLCGRVDLTVHARKYSLGFIECWPRDRRQIDRAYIYSFPDAITISIASLVTIEWLPTHIESEQSGSLIAWMITGTGAP